MNKILKKYSTRANFGLLLGILGSILIAFAIGELPCARPGTYDGGVTGCINDVTGVETNYRIVYFLSKAKFNGGIILLILAFLFQLKPKEK